MQIINHCVTPARTVGRAGRRVDRVVWHHTVGQLQGDLAVVCGPGARGAYHYVIARDGRVFRTGPEADTVWHAGNRDWNQRSIGIGHSHLPGQDWPDAQRNASVALTRDICRRHGIHASAQTIVPHRQIVATACPGTLPLPQWIALVAGDTVAPPPPPPVPTEQGDDMILLVTFDDGGMFAQRGVVYLVDWLGALPLGNEPASSFQRIAQGIVSVGTLDAVIGDRIRRAQAMGVLPR